MLYKQAAPVSRRARETKGNFNCFNHPRALTLLLALKIAVNRSCPAEEIEPHLESDP